MWPRTKRKPHARGAGLRAATDFELGIREPLAVTEPPTPAALLLLREEVDPHRYVIGRG